MAACCAYVHPFIFIELLYVKRTVGATVFAVSFSLLPWKDILSTVTVMAAEVQMVLYEDDSVQVQYIDGSRLQLSPCGSEFLFEKAPPVSAHPLQQPERIRQRTHFVISAYRVSKDDTKTTLFHTKILLRCPEYRKWLVFWITVILNGFSNHFLKLLGVFFFVGAVTRSPRFS